MATVTSNDFHAQHLEFAPGSEFYDQLDIGGKQRYIAKSSNFLVSLASQTYYDVDWGLLVLVPSPRLSTVRRSTSGLRDYFLVSVAICTLRSQKNGNATPICGPMLSFLTYVRT